MSYSQCDHCKVDSEHGRRVWGLWEGGLLRDIEGTSTLCLPFLSNIAAAISKSAATTRMGSHLKIGKSMPCTLGKHAEMGDFCSILGILLQRVDQWHWVQDPQLV